MINMSITFLLSIFAVVINATITLMHPVELKKEFPNKGIIESSLANFGHIEYGTSSMGEIIVPVSNKDGCKEFTENDFDEAGTL